MIRLVCLILLMGGSSLVAQPGVAEGTIDFRASDNLKAVYDAGFRPWRDGMDSCHLDHAKIAVILPEAAQFSLSAEMAEFEVLANNQLSSVSFYSEVTSTEEAVAKTKKICDALGISIEGLDQAVPDFRDRFSKPSRWGGKAKKGEISTQVMLDLLYFSNHIEAKVYVFLQWKRDGAPMKFLTTPIQPPPGYEDASMDPPWGDLRAKSTPEHDLSYYKGLIAQKKAAEGVAPSPIPAAPPAPAKAPVAAPPRTEFPWAMLLLVFLVLGSAWGLYRLSKNSGKR